jgi:uncharacterized RDD family membrane protein YckC
MPNSQITYPYLSDRVQALFIDTLLIVGAIFLISALLPENTADWVRIVCFIALWGMYEPVCNSLLGFTVGTYIKGLRVRMAHDPEKKINIFRSYIRSVIKYLLGWLSFITIHFNEERRAIHDLAAGSMMIKKPSN